MMRIFKNVVFSDNEILLSISYTEIINYVDAFYAVMMEWEDNLILTDDKIKYKLTLNKNSKLNSINIDTNLIFISENNIGYILSNLMFYYHFGNAQLNHIHLECYIQGSDRMFDFTLLFENFLAPNMYEKLSFE